VCLLRVADIEVLDFVLRIVRVLANPPARPRPRREVFLGCDALPSPPLARSWYIEKSETMLAGVDYRASNILSVFPFPFAFDFPLRPNRLMIPHASRGA